MMGSASTPGQACKGARGVPDGGSREPRRRPGLGESAEFTLARRGVIGAGFALPRDADQRSAFQAVPMLLLCERCAVPV